MLVWAMFLLVFASVTKRAAQQECNVKPTSTAKESVCKAVEMHQIVRTLDIIAENSSAPLQESFAFQQVNQQGKISTSHAITTIHVCLTCSATKVMEQKDTASSLVRAKRIASKPQVTAQNLGLVALEKLVTSSAQALQIVVEPRKENTVATTYVVHKSSPIAVFLI